LLKNFPLRRRLPLGVALIVLALTFYVLRRLPLAHVAPGFEAAELAFPIILLAFICEFVDSSLGMGYGTTLTPLLLVFGYEPSEIVPAVLFSEFVTGLAAAIFHHEFGNVNFRPGTRDFKVMLVMAALSIIGAILSVSLAVRLPALVVKVYIGLLVLSIGLWILKNHRREMSFSWRRIAGLGFLAAFNKGISGGGYGPVNVLTLTNAVMNQSEGNRLRIQIWADEAVYTENQERAHLNNAFEHFNSGQRRRREQ